MCHFHLFAGICCTFFSSIIIVFCMTYETNLRVLSDYDCSTIVQCHVIVELIKALPYGKVAVHKLDKQADYYT
jgi:hypothetical protein